MGLFLIVVMDHLIAYQVPGSFDPCLSMLPLKSVTLQPTTLAS